MDKEREIEAEGTVTPAVTTEQQPVVVEEKTTTEQKQVPSTEGASASTADETVIEPTTATNAPVASVQLQNLSVASLKHSLKQRKLSTDGFKADLISRLQEANVTAADVEKENQKHIAPTPDTNFSMASSETVIRKELSPEELKEKGIELLKQKLHRLTKFGSNGDNQQAIEDLNKEIQRVEKYGVDPLSVLAAELGYGKKNNGIKGINDELSLHKNKRKSHLNGSNKSFRNGPSRGINSNNYGRRRGGYNNNRFDGGYGNDGDRNRRSYNSNSRRRY
ncbi:Tho1p SCDLUD_000345 [Saccharomycodes ludwigii]|uniref:Tho1p n=1 Tax=Saccharomycodes ludwigii TaxID=36035 RepID=UPI001E842A9F|nr:hypothetical protein SCDLUD_000345 [Saccharomycodes ludwigii]KAH3902756.1 hypothetical protein SCDLUD_000345 [Saccharomycodes ludwigii]